MNQLYNEPMDAEYESIRRVFDSRGSGSGILPSKPVYFLPASTGRAEAIIALDRRIQLLRRVAPWILGAASMLISFLAGRAM